MEKFAASVLFLEFHVSYIAVQKEIWFVGGLVKTFSYSVFKEIKRVKLLC